MKRFNRRGSVTMALILFVAVMAVSMQFLQLGVTLKQNTSRHGQQLENLYNYDSLGELLASAIQQSFKGYQVSYTQDTLSGVTSYLLMSQELRGKFITGDDTYSLFSVEELIQNVTPVNGDTGKFIKDLVDSPGLHIQLRVSNLFIPNPASELNVLEFKSGDKLMYEPYQIEVTITGRGTSVSKSWEVRGVYADIAFSQQKIVLQPNFSQAVVRPRSGIFN